MARLVINFKGSKMFWKESETCNLTAIKSPRMANLILKGTGEFFHQIRFTGQKCERVNFLVTVRADFDASQKK